MDHPTVLAVCSSTRKGVAKRRLQGGELRAGHGLVGDAHAGPWHRQLSLLNIADIRTMEARGLTLAPGAFGENLVLDGVDLAVLGIGSRLAIGTAEVRITQIGKECHDRCAIYAAAGDCIMPRRGLFAEVVRGGPVAPGSAVRVLEVRPRSSLTMATAMHPEVTR